MRIVIDLQGAQTSGSRHRGIGRYSLWLAQAIVRNRGQHEILIALSDHFPDTIDAIRADFQGLLPPRAIHVWRALDGVSALAPDHRDRRHAAELIREAFLANLKPDFVLVTSLFEGLVDDAVTSIGAMDCGVPTATVLYDLIPHIHRDPYLSSLVARTWYDNKLDSLRRTHLALAISESSRREGIEHLSLDPQDCVCISTATDPRYRELTVDPSAEQGLRKKLGLTRQFVMYTGGIDHRKNIEGLIGAFARLPHALRHRYQLAVVCSVQPADKVRLSALAQEHGLGVDDFVLTGFVSDEDLLSLYNLCALFVFPSWHEGFGLPALEAMSCGRAVIAAGTSSLPEVIGREDALFDPHDEAAMAELIERVLVDEDFRLDLEQHGRVQSRCFSWDLSAQRAISAMEGWRARHVIDTKPLLVPGGSRRPRMAFVSPLPPERSGISDYSADLIPELSRHYRIDVIVVQAEVQSDWIHANCEIRGVEWFRTHARVYDRVLYHFGNSEFHAHMFALLREIPGVVVLHDFFLSGIVAHMEWMNATPGHWARQLQMSAGYPAVKERYTAADPVEIIMRYPANLEVLQMATGVLVHSAASLRMGRDWYGEESVADWRVIPLLRNVSVLPDRAVARSRLGIAPDDFLVCSFGMVAPTKLCAELHAAWLESSLAERPDCVLAFVGGGAGSDYANALHQALEEPGARSRALMTGWIDQSTYRDYLAAADVAVQLRTASRGETSAAVLDCMGSGLPTIVNANGSMADLDADVVCMLPDDFARVELVDALDRLARQPELRQRLRSAARDFVGHEHHPRVCADRYRDVIEHMYQEGQRTRAGLYQMLGPCVAELSEVDIGRVAHAVGLNQPLRPRKPKLLLDVSCLVHGDGAPEVRPSVQNLLRHWLQHAPAGLHVEPVYILEGQPGYRYARQFTLEFLECPTAGLVDDVVEYAPNDVFFGLELSLTRPAPREWLKAARRAGVDVRFLVWDLLPVLQPECFPDEAAVNLRDWLSAVGESSGAFCPSRASADALLEWMQCFGPERVRDLPIDLLRLGADSLTAKKAPPSDAVQPRLLEQMRRLPTFLMVGEIVPRRQYLQLVDAFEEIWQEGVDVNLVIVGSQGWQSQDTVERIRSCVELGRRLFWLEDARANLRGALLAHAHCLLVPGIDEGSGLSFIEAGQRGLHLLVRDCPSHREAAGPSATYFKSSSGAEIARAVRGWLADHANFQQRRTDETPRLSWEDTANGLLTARLAERHHTVWKRDGTLRYWGNDPRLFTQVGRRQGRSLQSQGVAGILMFGPYVTLPAGRYEISLFGPIGAAQHASNTLDVAIKKGTVRLVEAPIARDAPVSAGVGAALVTVDITLEEACDDLEVRVWVGAESRLIVQGLAIRPMR